VVSKQHHVDLASVVLLRRQLLNEVSEKYILHMMMMAKSLLLF